MTRAIPHSHPLLRLFRGITEHTFMAELGIADPGLIGYVAELLARFVPSDALWRLRDTQGRHLQEITAMVAEAENASDVSRRAEYHRHVGDFALFWTGVYPEALGTRQHASTPDHLLQYQLQGKRSYFVASTLEPGDEAPLLRRLSHEFELCAVGLSRVRRQWEQHAAQGPQGPALPGLL